VLAGFYCEAVREHCHPSASARHAALQAWAGIGEAGARHLLSRTGFGANPAQIALYAPLSRQQAVDRLLDHVSYTALTAPPAWVNEPFERPGKANLTEDEKKALQKERNEHAQELRGWWLEEMRITPSPLTEKMTLFWHNHFVSGLDKVGVPQLMYQQNVCCASRRWAIWPATARHCPRPGHDALSGHGE
jgi:uncharacterized protein (DUF1800 family)